MKIPTLNATIKKMRTLYANVTKIYKINRYYVGAQN